MNMKLNIIMNTESEYKYLQLLCSSGSQVQLCS